MEKLRPLQFILKSLQETYLDSDKYFFEERKETQTHRKWASSSDLISDGQKNNITLTPVSQIRITKQSPDQTTPEPLIVPRRKHSTSSDTTGRASVRSTNRHLLNPERLKTYDSKHSGSPVTDIDEAARASKSSRFTYGNDLNSTLRRRSYRRAVATEALVDERNRSSSEKESSVQNGEVRRRSLSEGPLVMKPSSTRDNHVRQHLLSSSFSNLGTGKDKERERGNQTMRRFDSQFGSEGNLSIRSSGRNSPSSITDSLRRSSPNRSTLAIVDSLRGEESVDDLDTCSTKSSPTSSRKQIKTPQKFLPVKHVSRTPSGTSSSSSESGESWRSVENFALHKINRVRKIPRPPTPENMLNDARLVECLVIYFSYSAKLFSWNSVPAMYLLGMAVRSTDFCNGKYILNR